MIKYSRQNLINPISVTSDPNMFALESELLLPESKIDIKKACQYTGLCYRTFYDKYRYKKFPYINYGRKPIFEANDIFDYILGNKVGDWTKTKYSDKEIIYGEKADIKECCKMTGLCYNTFYTNMIRDNIPHLKYDNKRVFLKNQIREWIEEKKRIYKDGKLRTN